MIEIFPVVTLGNPRIQIMIVISCLHWICNKTKSKLLRTKKRLQRNQELHNAFHCFDSSVPFFNLNFASGDLQIKETFSVSMIIRDF